MEKEMKREHGENMCISLILSSSNHIMNKAEAMTVKERDTGKVKVQY
jgi:hypothetical protein